MRRLAAVVVLAVAVAGCALDPETRQQLVIWGNTLERVGKNMVEPRPRLPGCRRV
jgi:hypothetical protein